MRVGPEIPLDNQDEETIAFERRPVEQTLILTACLAMSFFAAAYLFLSAPELQPPLLWFSISLAVWLLILAAIDLDRFLLPDLLTYPLILIGLVYSSFLGVGAIQSVAGALSGYGLIAGLAWFWQAYFGREGIGLGDAKLLAAIGAWCGIFALPIVLLVSSSTAITLLLLASAVRKNSIDTAVIPFGPLLCLGFWIAWLAL